MQRSLKAAFLVVILLGNLGAVFPQTVDSTEGCDTECCVTSQMALPETGQAAPPTNDSLAVKAVQAFCIIECRPSSEAPPSFSILAGIPPAQPVRETLTLQVLPSVDYIGRARFPDSPTTSFNGSSHRFLEHGSLLI